jgi:hypothetical protein
MPIVACRVSLYAFCLASASASAGAAAAIALYAFATAASASAFSSYDFASAVSASAVAAARADEYAIVPPASDVVNITDRAAAALAVASATARFVFAYGGRFIASKSLAV